MGYKRTNGNEPEGATGAPEGNTTDIENKINAALDSSKGSECLDCCFLWHVWVWAVHMVQHLIIFQTVFLREHGSMGSTVPIRLLTK